MVTILAHLGLLYTMDTEPYFPFFRTSVILVTLLTLSSFDFEFTCVVSSFL